MRYSATINLLSIFVLGFVTAGCYTQFQATERFPIEDEPRESYYSWEDEESAETGYYWDEDEYTARQYDAETYDDEQELAEAGVYYKDYETERWYKEQFENKVYWEGYNDGFEDGYAEARSEIPYSARYSFNRYRYLYGYTGAFDGYRFYRWGPDYYNDFWFAHSSGFYVYGGFYNYGYHPFYYSVYPFHGYNYYGYGYGYHNSYWGVVVYNDYHRHYNRYKKRSRDAELYRKGPRNSGLYSTRTRSDYKDNRSIYRSRSSSSSVRSRSSVGSSTRSRSDRSSVGRSRSGSSKRGSAVRSTGRSSSSKGSSVKKDTRSNSSSSKGRSRSGNLSNLNSSTDNDQAIRKVRSVSSRSLKRSYVPESRKIREAYRKKLQEDYSLYKTRTSALERFNNNAFKRNQSVNSRVKSAGPVNVKKNSGLSKTNRSIKRSATKSNTVKSKTRSSTRSSSKKSSSRKKRSRD